MTRSTRSSRPPLVLASGSARRHDLLRSAGVAFLVRPSAIDESALPGESPEAHARRLACEKARAVARLLDAPRFVIGADTIVVIDDAILGKPRDRHDARGMLMQLSGRTHRVITGYCVIDLEHREHVGAATTDVTFKTLDEREISRYLDLAAWSDKAGAYAVQEHAAYMVRAVSGSYTNVVGLPLCETLECLERAGFARGDAARDEG